MIRLSPAQRRRILAAAEAAWPEECCGLLVGRGHDPVEVTRVVPTANIAQDRHARFEVDPAARLSLERELRAARDTLDPAPGDERLVGHYHSHPGGPARPSPTDAARAFEPDLVWLVVAVTDGRATELAAWRFDPAARAFHPVTIAPI